MSQAPRSLLPSVSAEAPGAATPRHARRRSLLADGLDGRRAISWASAKGTPSMRRTGSANSDAALVVVQVGAGEAQIHGARKWLRTW
jgi:hypothetical protein